MDPTISTARSPYRGSSDQPMSSQTSSQEILRDKKVRIISPDEPIPGNSDSYLLKMNIIRDEAEKILKQTGLEIAFAPGETEKKNFTLGRGNFGTFCVGYATQKAHYVGIKITQGDDAAEAEVRVQEALSQLPHIMPSLDYCLGVDASQRSVLYQVMPLAGLGSVAKIAPAINALDDPAFKEQIFYVLAQAILKGLSSMHNKKFYHLDLKPDNLVVSGKGDIFLIDFGCSAESEDGWINPDEQNGDTRFFSPERLQTAIEKPLRRADRIDIWAAGLTMLSVATNVAFPQPDVNPSDIFNELCSTFSSLQNSDPASFWGFVKLMLNPDPSQRPTAQEAMNHPWYVEMAKTESRWKQSALDHLREMVQALQRDKRSVPIEGVPEIKGAESDKYKKPSPKGSDAIHYKQPNGKATEANPYKKPNYKDSVAQLPVSAAPNTAPSFNALSPQDLPLPHFADFIQRSALQQTLLEQLKTDLKSKPSSILACAGLGGSGKSQLVTYMLHKVKGQYGLALYFRSSDQKASLETQHLVLARELGLTDDKASVEKAVVALHTYFVNLPQPALIVYDNADDPDVLRPFLPPLGCQVILTTRSSAWENPIEIGPFSQEEGKELVEKILQREEPQSRLLCEELGYLPLAIVQACAYIRNQQLSVKSYIEKLQSMPQLLQEDQKLFGKKLPTSMGALWNITFETLRRESPKALKLLDVLAYLSPDGIPSYVLDAFDTTNAKEMLLKYALLQSDPSQSSFFIHRLLQRVVRAEKSTSQHQENLDSVMHVLKSIYVYQPKTLEERKTNHLLVPQGESVLSHYDRLLPTANSVPLFGTLLWVADGQRDQGNPKRTLEVLERSLLVAEAVYGRDHPNVAASLNNLGCAGKTLGETKKAIEYHEKALAIREKTYGRDHPDVAMSLNNLGNAWQTLGNPKKAIEYHERALAIKEHIHGRDHPDVAISLNNLGNAWDTLGETKKAIEYYERALVIYEKTYGKDHPSVADSLNNLGSAWQTLGETKKAIDYHERALAIREKTYGKDHLDVATSLNNLGYVWRTLGDPKKAIEYYERALAIREKTYGKDHPSVAASLNSLGIAWKTLGDPKKTIEYYERALAIREKTYGKDHPSVAASLNNLGNVWKTLGQTKKGMEYHERALVIYEKAYGKDHPDVAISLNNLGNAWSALGDSKKAIEYQERALAIREKTYGRDHPDVASSLRDISEAHREEKRVDLAIGSLDRALAILVKVYGESHSRVSAALCRLGLCWKDKGDGLKAVSLCEKALAIDEKLNTPDHADIATDCASLGESYLVAGDAKNAILFCERALASDTKRYPDAHPSVVRDLTALAKARLGNQERERGFKLLEQALNMARKIPGWTDSHPRIIEILQLIEKVSKEREIPQEAHLNNRVAQLRAQFEQKK